MRDTLLHITAQVHENGKPKGGQIFSLNVDSDAFMYAEDLCINAIRTLLAKRSNSYCVYTYVSHELIFMGIETLNDNEFDIELTNESQARHEADLINEQAEQHKAVNRYENGLGVD